MLTLTTAAELKELLAQNDKVIVDYFATWCGPCKVMAPVFARLAGDFCLAKVDVDDADDALLTGVKALPTFRAFFKGKKVGQVTGDTVGELTALAKKLDKL